MKSDGWLLDVRFDGDEAVLWIRTAEGENAKLCGNDREALTFDDSGSDYKTALATTQLRIR